MTGLYRFDEPVCPNPDQHQDGPIGYVQWHAWAASMARTHTQHSCTDCGRWTIWTPKPANPTGDTDGND